MSAHTRCSNLTGSLLCISLFVVGSGCGGVEDPSAEPSAAALTEGSAKGDTWTKTYTCERNGTRGYALFYRYEWLDKWFRSSCPAARPYCYVDPGVNPSYETTSDPCRECMPSIDYGFCAADGITYHYCDRNTFTDQTARCQVGTCCVPPGFPGDGVKCLPQGSSGLAMCDNPAPGTPRTIPCSADNHCYVSGDTAVPHDTGRCAQRGGLHHGTNPADAWRCMQRGGELQWCGDNGTYRGICLDLD